MIPQQPTREAVEPTVVIAGRYVLGRRIGNGKLSTVYQATDRRRDNELVAVKRLNSEHLDELRREFFRRETSALQSLNHPNIIRIREHGWSNTANCFYIVFDYFEHTLADYITAQQGAPSDSWSLACMRKLAQALAHAHSEGIIHRDIKPSNILIDDDRRPRLTDFGTSRLKYELATGTTLSAFWSAGYAAPEQRNGNPGAGDERSDIYSLGTVYYHLLSQKAPPADGPDLSLIDALQASEPVKQILKRMLARRPDERYGDAGEICRALEGIDDGKVVPEITLVATEHTRGTLCELGVIEDTTFLAAQAWLSDQLNGQDSGLVSILLEGRETAVLLTENVRIKCTADRVNPVFFVTDVEYPFGPDLEAQRAAARTFRAQWKLIRAFHKEQYTDAQLQVFAQNRSVLLNWLAEHKRRQEVKRDRRVERKGFVETWDKVLRYQRDLIDAQSGVPYVNVKEDPNYIVFTLREVFPDTYDWPLGAVVANDDGRGRENPVGTIVSITGTTVVVGRDATLPSESLDDQGLSRSGLLSLYRQEERAAIKRQQDALAQLQAGSTVNPKLLDVLIDPRKAECDDPDPDIRFFQENLAPDKQAAVREALASQDLYLLQGPPGTGKTTAIAEIILQILAAKPDARILVSSQSNVAVNHVLACVARYHDGHPLEIVRMGREEKIGQGAEVWSLDRRLAQWRQEVTDRCEGVLGELKEQERQLRKQAKASDLDGVDAVLGQCAEWIAEADALVQRLREDEQLLAGIARHVEAHPHLNDERMERTRQRMHELQGSVQSHHDVLAGHLDVIQSVLPPRLQETARVDVYDEYDRLVAVLKNFTDRDEPETLLRKRRKLVQDWRNVFGRTDEFKAPLIARANILAATCLFVGARSMRGAEFDWVIVDEAGRATAPEILAPLVRAHHAIIVGDERQLPPLLDDDLAEERLSKAGIVAEGIERSLFESLVEEAKHSNPRVVRMLTAQYRMHPAIGRLISAVFYDNILEHGVAADERMHNLPWMPRPVGWMSTSRLANRHEIRRGSSYANPVEVTAIEEFLMRIEASYRETGERRQVAVISGYAGQIEDLRIRLVPEDGTRWSALEIEVATVDAFQGRDSDIVIYSTVRSNAEHRLGFLRDRRRLNVALSRARQLLCLVGDAVMLGNAETGRVQNPFEEIIVYMRAHPDDCAMIDLERSSG